MPAEGYSYFKHCPSNTINRHKVHFEKLYNNSDFKSMKDFYHKEFDRSLDINDKRKREIKI